MSGVQDEDMYLFQGGLDQTPGAFAGQDFDTFLESPGDNIDQSSGFLNPNDLSIKQEQHDPRLTASSGLPRSSRSSASSGSTSGSAEYATGNVSNSSTISPSISTRQQPWSSGINGMSMPSTEQYYDDTVMGGLGDDLDASNQEMASAFDFETAASTPSGYDAASIATIKTSSAQPFRRVANITNFGQSKPVSSRLPVGNQSQFYIAGSREASPLSAMLPQNQTPSPWTKHSPSSGLEETFNHITMNGDSPGNATFSPNMQYNPNGFSYDPDSSGTPSTYNKDISSPPSTIHSGDGNTHFTINPTSLKSRVETQIPIKMVIHPLPPGAKKLRLPTHTVSKPKFLAKPEVDRSPEVLELHTSLVCTSAMQDPVRLERALARARGEDLSTYSKPSPESSTGSQASSKDDDEKPLNGGEVKICSGCIQRERKRASRKKQKKPEEEELFQKDEERRVVVFNTSEIKDWVEVTKDNPQQGGDQTPLSPPGAMQVELPMRIACYCRHQNEKMGFQVIFTIRDFRDKVIAQALTNSIMITDDHKTHNTPATVQTSQMPQMPTGPQLPGAGVFSTSGMDIQHGTGNNAKLFKQSFSTTDLHNLQHNFNPHFPMSPTSNPFAITGPMSAATSGTMTPRNLSRPASPSGPGGPHSKRRKQSGSGKLPSGLTMTRLDTAPAAPIGPATMPNTAASSPYATNMTSFMSPAERYPLASSRQQTYGTSPPTPTGNEQAYNPGINRTFSLENLPRQALISAPSSRQPSRPNSPPPHSNRNSFGAPDPGFGQAVNNGLINQPSRRPNPTIHKLVPAEGSVTGGTEVTLLGNGFYQGLEVMFGDTEATTTTFWGEKCLNCIAPPALQPGVVAVMFKHEHPQYSTMQPQSQTRHSVFTYVDDREVEILRLALRTLGKTMQHPTDDPYSAAQQLLQQNQAQGMWPQSGGYSMGGHQRQISSLTPNQMNKSALESDLLLMLAEISHFHNGKAILNLRRPSGLTLLQLASSLGMSKFVVALLSAGASPNTIDNSGHSAMHHAAMYGHAYIIRSLRDAGGDDLIRSLRNYKPADLATTLRAYQATFRPLYHCRSSSASIIPHNAHSPGTTSTSSSSYNDQSDESEVEVGQEDIGLINKNSLRGHEKHVSFQGMKAASRPSSRSTSRRSSVQPSLARTLSDDHTSVISNQSDPPGTLLQAWRQLMNSTYLQQQQLADQIQHLQETAQWAMPQLLASPQDSSVVRRMSSLFPLRPTILERSGNGVSRDGWWETIKRSSISAPAPPAYDELYPGSTDSPGDIEMKKSSAIIAATDAAADLHFVSRETTLNNKQDMTRNTMETNVRPHVQKVELMKDRRLFFFWIPILAIILGLMLSGSGILDVITMIVNGFNTQLDRMANNIAVV